MTLLKILFTVVLLAFSYGVSLDAHAISTADKMKLCKGVAQMGERYMQRRQEGVPMYAAMQDATDSCSKADESIRSGMCKMFRAVVALVYSDNYARFSTPQLQKEEVVGVSNALFSACYAKYIAKED